MDRRLFRLLRIGARFSTEGKLEYVSHMEQHGHGGDRRTAGELWGRPAEDFLDFSANINPLGPPWELIGALQAALMEKGPSVLTEYPDPECRTLRRMLAEFHQVPEEGVIVGNGGAELIGLVNEAVQPRRVGVIHPSFAEYEKTSRKRRQEVRALPVRADEDFQPQEGKMLELIRNVDLFFLGQPNNPCGTLLSADLLEEAAHQAACHGTVLAVDEAFLDFVVEGENRSLIRQIEKYPTTVVIRSMTKFYALPGLRLGYAVGHPEWIRRMGKGQTPWSVNSLAQLAGEVALGCSTFRTKTHRWLQREQKYVVEQLKRIQGVEALWGEVNFLLIRLRKNGITAAQLQESLGQSGVMIRDASTFAGLDSRYIRVAVRSRAENRQLVTVLKRVLESGGDDKG